MDKNLLKLRDVYRVVHMVKIALKTYETLRIVTHYRASESDVHGGSLPDSNS